MILGNGIDIIEVARIKAMFKRWGNSFLKRVFTEKEIEIVVKRNYSFEHIAGRFAAKEAVMKAFSFKGLGFHDIEIVNDNNGKPYCSMKSNDLIVNLSISHTKDYGVASAIIEQKS